MSFNRIIFYYAYSCAFDVRRIARSFVTAVSGLVGENWLLPRDRPRSIEDKNNGLRNREKKKNNPLLFYSSQDTNAVNIAARIEKLN